MDDEIRDQVESPRVGPFSRSLREVADDEGIDVSLLLAAMMEPGPKGSLNPSSDPVDTDVVSLGVRDDVFGPNADVVLPFASELDEEDDDGFAFDDDDDDDADFSDDDDDDEDEDGGLKDEGDDGSDDDEDEAGEDDDAWEDGEGLDEDEDGYDFDEYFDEEDDNY